MRQLAEGGVRLLATTAGAALLLAGSSAPSQAQDANKTIRAVMQADVKVFDPIFNTADITSFHSMMVFDMLFAMDKDLAAKPQMVGQWSLSEDGLTYTFTLRDGLKWHDGQPVTAEDAVLSLKRWGVRDGAGQQLMKLTRDLAAVDAKTFKLTLSEPYGLVLDSFAKPSANVAAMMPKRLAMTDPFQQIPDVIGSGPFKFAKEEWVPGSKIVYLKNTDYVPRAEPPSGIAGGKVAKADRVEWVVMPDPQTAASALTRGEVDFFEQPPTDLLPMLRAAKGVKVETLNPLGTEGILRLNHLQPPFNNPKARQAVLWMVNQKDYLQAMIGDPQLMKVCGALLVCGSSMGSEAGAEALLSTLPENERIAKAKALLAEAGYKGELVVLLDPAERPRFHAANLVLAAAMKKAGINVQIDAMDWGTLVTRRAKKEPPGQGGWSAFHTSSGGLEASNPAFHIAISAGCDKAWFGWPCDAEVEKLRTQWALARSLPERQKVAEAIQKRAMEVVVYIPYGQWSSPVAYRDTLKGLIAVPDSIVWWNVEKM